MGEKPIIFSTAMVRAILDGRKTQTRRVIKPQPTQINNDFDGTWEWKDKEHYYDDLTLCEQLITNCQYGNVGDTLWVRETWATPGNYDHIKPRDLSITMIGCSEVAYRATEEHGDPYYKWRPSIFMPRWASRITLEIIGVRVEQVQDISTMDALAEGCVRTEQRISEITKTVQPPVANFGRLWDSINAKRGYGWDVNPWVWVIEFKNIDL